MKTLFETLTIKHLTLKNRICVPPMVYFKLSDDSGMVTDRNVAHYSSIAKGGFGAVIVEANAINKQGRLSFDQLGLWSDEHIEGHRRIVEAVHAEGVPIFVQIHHAGVMGVEAEVVSASEYTLRNKTAVELTTAQVEAIEDLFADAAVRAEKAGYDGVELHGAHNYLLTQFLNNRVNKRSDKYGQDVTLVVKNIMKKIRERTNADFVVGIRMGAFEPTLIDGIEHAMTFEQIGMDYLNVSSGFSHEADPQSPDGFAFADVIYGAGEIKKHVSETLPVFAVNGITTREQAEGVLEQTNVDMVCIGRGTLVNPNWANDAKDGKNVGKCISCPNCIYRTGEGECPGRKLLARG